MHPAQQTGALPGSTVLEEQKLWTHCSLCHALHGEREGTLLSFYMWEREAVTCGSHTEPVAQPEC